MPKPKKHDLSGKPPKKEQTRNHVQVSMTLDPTILAKINRFANLSGLSRSAFLMTAAMKEIARMEKGGAGDES